MGAGDALDERTKALRLSRALLVSPAFLTIFAVLIIPLGATVWLSTTSWQGVGTPQFIGLTNYRSMFSSGDFLSMLWRTLTFAGVASVGAVIVGIALAELIRTGIKGASVFSALWFVPVVTPVTAVGIFFSNAMTPLNGGINVALGRLGLGNTHNWLFDPHQAIFVLAAVWIWIEAGFVFVICLSAMRAVPPDLYEAAQIDGARPFHNFRSITMPLIWPVVGVVFLLQLVYTFNGFVLIWSMTMGGPGNATETLPVEIYRQAFLNGAFGYASAIGVGGGFALAIITLLVLHFTRSRIAV
jgi:ABC-type sugar transport system permease subunit